MRNFLLALLSVVVLFTSCAKENKPQKKVRLLLDWWANPNHIALYAGQKKGIFEKHGVDLEIISLQDPPDALMYLLSDNVEISLYYLPLCLRVYGKTKNFRVIGKLIDKPLYTLMAREDAGIASFEDFSGKTIGHFGDTLSKAAFDALESDYNVSFKEKKVLSFDPSTALYTGAIDVISGVYWNIEMYQLENQGVRVKCFKWEDFNFPSYPELVFVSKDDFINDNPKMVKAFQDAIEESILFAAANKEEAYLLYESSFDEKKLPWEKKAWEVTAPLLAKDQKLNTKRIKKIYNWLADRGLFEGSFDPVELIDAGTSVE
ncbi:MAG: putative thiamine biosynthesis protein [Chlamydiia bacterium]|nr:putative thiamine biosynthesis protein [Chlamydiia bacterium]